MSPGARPFPLPQQPSGPTLDAYIPVLGEAEIEEIRRIARAVAGARIQHVNSTRAGGGVAEILERRVPLEVELGLDARWDVLRGNGPFFEVTKTFHNALHGASVRVLPEHLEIYNRTLAGNLDVIRTDADVVVAHDTQPAGLIRGRDRNRARWIWRCHVDLSEADVTAWGFVRAMVESYDAAVFHLPDYTKDLMVPQYLVPPAIDPLSPKNEELAGDEVRAEVEGLGIDPDLPIVLQVSRFDHLKDPLGVIDAFEMASGWEPSQLVLAGGGADDDPEGAEVLARVRERAAGVPHVHVLCLPPDSHRAVNALQRAARIVVQKSVREGFGLVVTEAMWKRKPVIGTAVGGIRRQILHGITGFLVHGTEGMAYRIRQLLGDPELGRAMGERARENVRLNYLLPTSLKQWLLLYAADLGAGAGITRLNGTLR